MAVLDTIFSQNLVGRYDKFKDKQNSMFEYKFDDLLLQYVTGARPRRGVDWQTCHSIYVPLNLGNLHWVALEIDLENCFINVLDSNLACFKDKKFEEYMAPFQLMLPLLLHQSGKFSHLGPQLEHPWQFLRLRNLPKNSNG